MKERGDSAAVQTYLNDARRVADALLQAPPSSERHRKILANALSRLAEAHADFSDLPAAIRWQEAALALTDNEADRQSRRSVLGRYKAASRRIEFGPNSRERRLRAHQELRGTRVDGLDHVMVEAGF